MPAGWKRAMRKQRSAELQLLARLVVPGAQGLLPRAFNSCCNMCRQRHRLVSLPPPSRPKTNALAAYQRQVERAQEAERKREEADRRWREVRPLPCCARPPCIKL